MTVFGSTFTFKQSHDVNNLSIITKFCKSVFIQAIDILLTDFSPNTNSLDVDHNIL